MNPNNQQQQLATANSNNATAINEQTLYTDDIQILDAEKGLNKSAIKKVEDQKYNPNNKNSSQKQNQQNSNNKEQNQVEQQQQVQDQEQEQEQEEYLCCTSETQRQYYYCLIFVYSVTMLVFSILIYTKRPEDSFKKVKEDFSTWSTDCKDVKLNDIKNFDVFISGIKFYIGGNIIYLLVVSIFIGTYFYRLSRKQKVNIGVIVIKIVLVLAHGILVYDNTFYHAYYKNIINDIITQECIPSAYDDTFSIFDNVLSGKLWTYELIMIILYHIFLFFEFGVLVQACFRNARIEKQSKTEKELEEEENIENIGGYPVYRNDAVVNYYTGDTLTQFKNQESYFNSVNQQGPQLQIYKSVDSVAFQSIQQMPKKNNDSRKIDMDQFKSVGTVQTQFHSMKNNQNSKKYQSQGNQQPKQQIQKPQLQQEQQQTFQLNQNDAFQKIEIENVVGISSSQKKRNQLGATKHTEVELANIQELEQEYGQQTDKSRQSNLQQSQLQQKLQSLKQGSGIKETQTQRQEPVFNINESENMPQRFSSPQKLYQNSYSQQQPSAIFSQNQNQNKNNNSSKNNQLPYDPYEHETSDINYRQTKQTSNQSKNNDNQDIKQLVQEIEQHQRDLHQTQSIRKDLIQSNTGNAGHSGLTPRIPVYNATTQNFEFKIQPSPKHYNTQQNSINNNQNQYGFTTTAQTYQQTNVTSTTINNNSNQINKSYQGAGIIQDEDDEKSPLKQLQKLEQRIDNNLSRNSINKSNQKNNQQQQYYSPKPPSQEKQIFQLQTLNTPVEVYQVESKYVSQQKSSAEQSYKKNNNNNFIAQNQQNSLQELSDHSKLQQVQPFSNNNNNNEEQEDKVFMEQFHTFSSAAPQGLNSISNNNQFQSLSNNNNNQNQGGHSYNDNNDLPTIQEQKSNRPYDEDYNQYKIQDNDNPPNYNAQFDVQNQDGLVAPLTDTDRNSKINPISSDRDQLPNYQQRNL